MEISLGIFAFALVSLSAFFALKEREHYRGRPFALTRFLEARSSRAEELFRAGLGIVRSRFYGVLEATGATLRYIFHLVSHQVRILVVKVARAMVRFVRGEKLLESDKEK